MPSPRAATRFKVASDQPGRLGRVALPGGQDHGAVGQLVGSHRLGDGLGLLDQRGGRGELARVQVHADPLGDGDREQAERAEVAGQLEMPCGERLPSLVVPQVVGAVGGHEEPAHRVLEGEVGAAEGAHRALHDGVPAS